MVFFLRRYTAYNEEYIPIFNIMIKPLETGQLYVACDIEQFSFNTTDQLPDLKELICQDRALQALHF